MTLAVNRVALELHEHVNSVQGVENELLAQNRDVHVLAIEKLVTEDSIENYIFSVNVRVFAKHYLKQKEHLLLVNASGNFA